MRKETSVFLYFPDNKGWSHQILRLIGEAHYGGGDFGEIHRAASGMSSGNHEDWHREWKNIAEYVERLAGQASMAGRKVTAMQAYFRAFNYFRMADFYLDRDDPREIPTYLKSVECFRRAAELSHGRVQPVEIPYEATMLTGYFVRAGAEDSRGPCLIYFGGADALCEEMYFAGAKEATARGISCLLLDGPGQGGSLRLRRIFSRPDYEKSVSAAIDFLEKRGGVDSKRIAVMGRSMGGYYAPRAAAFEDRLRACVSYDSCYSVLDDIFDYFPPIRRAIIWLTGSSDEADARGKLKAFTLKGVVEKIKCPLLIVHGEDDYVASPKAARKIYEEARCTKELKIWKAGHGIAAYRAEALAYVADWLADILA